MSSVVADLLTDSPIISPFKELIAYEYLWSEQGSSFKKIAEILSKKDKLPSQIVEEKFGFVPPAEYPEIEAYIKDKIGSFSVMLKENVQYPQKLLDAKYPIDLFYYRGDLQLLETPSVSIVGTRRISVEGERRARKLSKMLCENGFTIVSGLAKGVDTVALNTAISLGKSVIGVIGTPIDEFYPRENRDLQTEIYKNHLLMSQVPFYKYKNQPFNSKRIYFPERNITMAAISDATVIVEASDTSGTMTQAKACLEQNRKLFILNSCFENPDISWPAKFQDKGAIRVYEIEDILSELGK